MYIEPGSPWENGYCERFNEKMQDEKLNGEIFYTLRGAQIVLEIWRKQQSTIRPHSSLEQRPSAPAANLPLRAGCSLGITACVQDGVQTNIMTGITTGLGPEGIQANIMTGTPTGGQVNTPGPVNGDFISLYGTGVKAGAAQRAGTFLRTLSSGTGGFSDARASYAKRESPCFRSGNERLS